MTGEAGGPPLEPISDREFGVGIYENGDLRGGRCDECGAVSIPRAAVCRLCGGDTSPAAITPTGIVYSFTTVHVSSRLATPYSLAYVDLDDGLRVLGRAGDSARHIGAAVRAVPDDGPTGWVFSPAKGETT